MNILLTGGAGFIGSHLAAALLQKQEIGVLRILDNLATGSMANISGLEGHPKLEFVQGDIRDYATCQLACKGMDAISHQAALGSVPRSINDPILSNEVNVSGTLHIFTAAKEAGIRRVVYAASSAAYGDHPDLPKTEDKIGKPLSPYAVTKLVNELYAGVFARTYGMEPIGLRYFNVFGPHQNPAGPYAAVVPLFIQAVLNNEPPRINGNGSHSRDFTYVDNAVQANMLALTTTNKAAVNEIYNIACGERTCLSDLFEYIKGIAGSDLAPHHGPERPGDVAHSLADIGKARSLLGYQPAVPVRQGLKTTFEWYRKHHRFGYS